MNYNEFDLIDLPNNYFIVRFLQKDGWLQQYQKILYEGPWTIQQHTILVQRWTPTFDPYHNPLGRVALWVRIPNIPIQCYNRAFISRLGNRIGKTIKVDLLTPSENPTATARVERGRYARICVELDLQRKLVSKVIAANMVYQVEYEGLGLICFGCGRYGHRKENCSWSPVNPTQVNPNQPPSPAAVTTPSPARKPTPPPGEAFGSWMIAGRNNKTRFPKGQYPVGNSTHFGRGQKGASEPKIAKSTSRFHALADLEEEEESINVGVEQLSREGVTNPVGLEGEIQQSSRGREKNTLTIGGKKSQRKNQVINEGPRVPAGQRSNGKENKKPNGPDVGPKTQWEVKNKKGEAPSNTPTMVGQGDRKTSGPREHIVVGGSLKQLSSEPVSSPRLVGTESLRPDPSTDGHNTGRPPNQGVNPQADEFDLRMALTVFQPSREIRPTTVATEDSSDPMLTESVSMGVSQGVEVRLWADDDPLD